MLAKKIRKNVEYSAPSRFPMLVKIRSILMALYNDEVKRLYFRLPSTIEKYCDFSFSSGKLLGIIDDASPANRALMGVVLLEQALERGAGAVYVKTKASRVPAVEQKLTALSSYYSTLTICEFKAPDTIESIYSNSNALIIIDDVAALPPTPLVSLMSLLRIRKSKCILGVSSEADLSKFVSQKLDSPFFYKDIGDSASFVLSACLPSSAGFPYALSISLDGPLKEVWLPEL